MSLLGRLKTEWGARNTRSKEQIAADVGMPTEAQKEFAKRIKKEIVFKENGLGDQSSEQKG